MTGYFGDTTLILDAGEERIVYAFGDGVLRVEQTGEEASSVAIVRDPSLQVRFDLEGRRPEEARSVVTNVSWTEPPMIGISQPTLSHRTTLRN